MVLILKSERARCNKYAPRGGTKSQGIPSTIGVNSRVISKKAVGNNRDKIYYGNQVGGVGIRISSKSKCACTHPIYNNNPYCSTIIRTIKFSTNIEFNNALIIYFGEESPSDNMYGFTTDEIANIGQFADPITAGNIAYWDVSEVTDMSNAFNANTDTGGSNAGRPDRAGFNENIGCWDVSKVTNMENFLFKQHLFNQNLNHWDVSNVTTTRNMFVGCYVFNQPLNNWDVSSVTDAFSMFLTCIVFNQPLNNWAFPLVTFLNLGSMFKECSVFSQDLRMWIVLSTANVTYMFFDTPMVGTTLIDSNGTPQPGYFTNP